MAQIVYATIVWAVEPSLEASEKKIKKDQSAYTRPVGFVSGKNIHEPWKQIILKNL